MATKKTTRRRSASPADPTEPRAFSVVIEQDEDGYFVASVPELPGCHTQAKSLDMLMERTREAILACLDADDSAGRSRFIGVQRIAV
jgi:predicted RNase H-like HicB family nuclease